MLTFAMNLYTDLMLSKINLEPTLCEYIKYVLKRIGEKHPRALSKSPFLLTGTIRKKSLLTEILVDLL